MYCFNFVPSVTDRHTDVCVTSGKALVNPLGDGSDHLTLMGLLFYGTQSERTLALSVIGTSN
jgi:hypothetical protein